MPDAVLNGTAFRCILVLSLSHHPAGLTLLKWLDAFVGFKHVQTLYLSNHINHVFNRLNPFDGGSKVTKAGNLRSFQDHFPATILIIMTFVPSQAGKRWSGQCNTDSIGLEWSWYVLIVQWIHIMPMIGAYYVILSYYARECCACMAKICDVQVNSLLLGVTCVQSHM